MSVAGVDFSCDVPQVVVVNDTATSTDTRSNTKKERSTEAMKRVKAAKEKHAVSIAKVNTRAINALTN